MRAGTGHVVVGIDGDAVLFAGVVAVGLDQVLHAAQVRIHVHRPLPAQCQHGSQLEAGGRFGLQVRVAHHLVAQRAVIEQVVALLQVGHAVALPHAGPQREGIVRLLPDPAPNRQLRCPVLAEVGIVLPAHTGHQLPGRCEEQVALQEQLLVVAPHLAIGLQFGLAVLCLRQRLAVQIGPHLPLLVLHRRQIELQAQVVHALLRMPVDGADTVGQGLAVGFVVFVHAAHIQHGPLAEAMPAAQRQPVAADAFRLVLRLPHGRHEGGEALQVVFLVATEFGRQPGLRRGLPEHAARCLFATDTVALAGPAGRIRRKALVTQPVVGQTTPQAFGTALHMGLKLLHRRRHPLAGIVLAPARANAHLDGALHTRGRPARDDIDHASHGRTAVLGRCRPLDHLHPLHVTEQILAEIHRRTGTGRDGQAIDEHQHLIARQPLHDQRITGLAVQFLQLQAVDVGQRLLQRLGAGGAEFFGTDHLRAHGRLVTRLFRAGAGDHHVLQAGGAGMARGRICGHGGRRQTAPDARQGKNQRASSPDRRSARPPGTANCCRHGKEGQT